MEIGDYNVNAESRRAAGEADMARKLRQGIQSVEIGMRLLNAFAGSATNMTLSALARAAAMHPSKAHRYLVSLIRAGYVAQDPVDGHYGLGPRAMSLGLAAIRQLNVVRFGEGIITELREATQQTISMVMWANRGPTIVHVSEADTPIMVTVRVGSVLPLLNSANGQLFLAYLPRGKTERLIESELAACPKSGKWKAPRSMSEVERRVKDIRRRRMTRTEQPVVPGVVSLSAPVFDHRGELVCTLALVGSAGNLDLSWGGAPARSLAAAATRFSQRLGWSNDARPIPPPLKMR